MTDTEANPFYAIFEPKPGAEIFESSTNVSWFEEPNIFVTLPVVDAQEMTLESLKTDEKRWKDIFGERKIHWISVANPEQKIAKEAKNYLGKIFPQYVSSLAIIGKTPMARVFVNLFFAIYPSRFPTKMFANKEEALRWSRKQASQMG